MMKKIILILAIIQLLTPDVLKGGKGPAAFMDMGAGARALAMGGAFTAVADDATAGYWNPAGLAGMDNYRLALMFRNLHQASWPGIEEITPEYHFMSAVLPFRKITGEGTLSVSLIRYVIDQVPHTYFDSGGYIVRNEFENADTAVLLSYGYPLLENQLKLGGSLKFIRKEFLNIDGATGSGWDADLGVILSMAPRLDFGVVLNRGASVEWESGHRDADTLKTRLGLSYHYQKGKINIISAVDVLQEEDMPAVGNAGIEFCYSPELDWSRGQLNSFALRSGINSVYLEDRYDNVKRLNEEVNWNLGGGLKLDVYNFNLALDYAFTFRRLGSNHVFSFSIGETF